MVIQRIQSVYLLLAALVLAALCFCVPVGVVQDNQAVDHSIVYVKDFMALLPLGITTAVLLLVDIFLYKNLKLQIRVATVCIVMIVAFLAVGTLLFTMRVPDNVSVTWLCPALVAVAALILVMFARRGMIADQRLLKSYDRIR